MQEFVITSKGDFNVDNILKRFPFLSNHKQVKMIRNDDKSKYNILPHKFLLVINIDKIEEIANMAQMIPTVEFKINYLLFPRITLD